MTATPARDPAADRRWSRPSTWPAWVFAALAAASTLAVFGVAVAGDFVFDDEFFIQKNAWLGSWRHLGRLLTHGADAGSGQASNLYRPLQSLTHLLDMQAWGPDPRGHHLTNVLLFAAAAAAVFGWLLAFAPAPWAFLACLLYVLHPLQCEAVAYISGRGDVLGLLFLCLGCLLFRRSLLAALACAALAVASKESLVLFPVFLLARELVLGRELAWRRHLPFWGLSGLYTVLRLTCLDFAGTLNFYGAQKNIFTENPVYRLYTWLTTIPGSLRLWAWPSDLHHERSWSVWVDPALPAVWGSALFLAALVLLAVWCWRRARPVSCGIALYLVATLPTSNLVAIINALFYDHWFIIPGLGLAAVAAFLLSRLPPSAAAPAALLSLPLFAVLSWTSVRGCLVWRDAGSLYTHILRFEPGKAKIHNNLAMHLAGQGRTIEAAAHYRQAIALDDCFPQTHHNLAQVLLASGQVEAAVQEFRRALSLDPRFHHSHLALGVILFQAGRIDEGLAHAAQAVQLHPGGAEARVVLSRMLKALGRQADARAVLQEGLRLGPGPALEAELQGGG